jgi:hypothetical protein
MTLFCSDWMVRYSQIFLDAFCQPLARWHGDRVARGMIPNGIEIVRVLTPPPNWKQLVAKAWHPL